MPPEVSGGAGSDPGVDAVEAEGTGAQDGDSGKTGAGAWSFACYMYFLNWYLVEWFCISTYRYMCLYYSFH